MFRNMKRIRKEIVINEDRKSIELNEKMFDIDDCLRYTV